MGIWYETKVKQKHGTEQKKPIKIKFVAIWCEYLLIPFDEMYEVSEELFDHIRGQPPSRLSAALI